jgi:hypothetical protein
VIGGDIVYPLDKLADVLGFYANYITEAPDDLYVDFVVASKTGTTEGAVVLNTCYSGPESGADAIYARIGKIGTPLVDGTKSIDYVALQRSWDNTDPRNTGIYLKSGFINEFPDTLVDAIVQNYKTYNERGTTMFFQHSGGAIARVPADATAFAHRKSIANMFAVVEWPLAEPRDSHVNYIKEYWKTFEPFTDGWYTNEVADQSEQVVDGNYQGNYARLLQVKNTYDPTNLFRLNANIQPTV